MQQALAQKLWLVLQVGQRAAQQAEVPPLPR